jgi:hypothetical protein
METESCGNKEGVDNYPHNSSQKSTIDLAGSGAKHATPQKMKQLLDKLREEQKGL